MLLGGRTEFAPLISQTAVSKQSVVILMVPTLPEIDYVNGRCNSIRGNYSSRNYRFWMESTKIRWRNGLTFDNIDKRVNCNHHKTKSRPQIYGPVFGEISNEKHTKTKSTYSLIQHI